VIAPGSSELDMRCPENVEAVFLKYRPAVVFSLAARVGGILDNKLYPADYYYDNILIGAHVFEFCARFGVEKLVNVGAGCGYPLRLIEPLKEEELFDGLPQEESIAYSSAKKMLVIQSQAYRRQHGLSAVTVIPSNLYGAHDNFNLERAHVIPALVRKFLEATNEDLSEVEIWGNGTAKRDFIHAADLAKAMVLAAVSYDSDLPLNVAYGKQFSIRQVVENLQRISGFQGELVWNENKPSGQKSREMSRDNINYFLPEFSPAVDLREGLKRTYEWLQQNYNSGARL